MYLREIKGKKRTYLSLVEGYREGDKVKQRTLFSFGAISDLNKTEIYNLASKLLQYCDQPLSPSSALPEEMHRQNWGAVKIVKELWSKFHLTRLCNTLLRKRKLKYDLVATIQLLLTTALCPPCSQNTQDYYSGLPKVALQDFYKALDELSHHQQMITDHLYHEQCRQFKIAIDVVFFNVTTFYFESTQADVVREVDFSKDMKVNEAQVFLTLITNIDGKPLGYDFFPGIPSEGKTLLSMLEKMKNKYRIRRVIMVADQGICTADNLAAIANAGYEYIIGTPMRNAKKSVKDAVHKADDYQILSQSEDHLIKYKSLPSKKTTSSEIKERWLCTWSSQRAAKDARDREMLVMSTQQMTTDAYNSSRGVRKKTELKAASLTRDKIEDDKTRDGYYAIATNNHDMSLENIVDAHHHLAMIEDSFRLMKNQLETKPLFNWTATRMKGHILLCFITLLFKKTLELALKSVCQEQVTPSIVSDTLLSMEFSTIKQNKQTLYMRAPLSTLAKNILALFKIQEPPVAQKTPY